MKTDDLKALGLTQEAIDAIMAMNGRDHAASQKALTDMTAARDALQEQLNTATAALKNFEGLDVNAIKKQAADAQKALEAATAKYQADLTARDQRDWLKQRFDALGVKSPFARKQLETEIMGGKAGPTWKDGAFFGFDDYMTAAKNLDASLYQTDAEKAAAEKGEDTPQQPKPKFTTPAGSGTPENPIKPVPVVW